MILNSKNFIEASQSILYAIDNKNASLFTETLELVAEGKILKMNVTNREYYTSVLFNLEEESNLVAAVNAKLFLSLISKITSPTIEITCEDRFINIKGNGDYKLPMIYNNDSLIELPKIEINNVTNEFKVESKILQSILNYNSKELQRGVAVKPVQNYYYVDDKGAITFTSGACVNSFELESPVKLLLSDKIVKLFKLFKDVEFVNVTLGQEPIDDETIQTRVKFESDSVVLTAKLPDSNSISSVPVDAIRGMATKDYLYSVVMHKNELLQTLGRLRLFNDGTKNYGKFDFSKDQVLISDWSSNNKEVIKYTSDCPNLNEYSALLNTDNLSLIVSDCEDEYVTLCFGDGKAFSCIQPTIVNILPEMKLS